MSRGGRWEQAARTARTLGRLDRFEPVTGVTAVGGCDPSGEGLAVRKGLPSSSMKLGYSGIGGIGVVPDSNAAIDKNWAWGGASGAGITVAVVDSGLDAAHPAASAADRAAALRWTRTRKRS